MGKHTLRRKSPAVKYVAVATLLAATAFAAPAVAGTKVHKLAGTSNSSGSQSQSATAVWLSDEDTCINGNSINTSDNEISSTTPFVWVKSSTPFGSAPYLHYTLNDKGKVVPDGEGHLYFISTCGVYFLYNLERGVSANGSLTLKVDLDGKGWGNDSARFID